MMIDLGFDKDPAQTRVVVAMSGGVDSSTVAAMLARAGYEVIGITLQLYDHGLALAKKGACCAGQDLYDARRVSEEIGFPHYILNYESRFQDSVMDDFADSYLRGETPIPCVRCNQTVKFRDLLQTARELEADCLATGHYIRREINPQTGRAELHRAEDGGKDQSYFLFATTQEQLDFLRFPLGALPKSETRRMAASFGLDIADKPDSQDICFVPNGDYAGIVKKLRPQAVKNGRILHLDGREMGRHDGILHYTIGQRRGLGLGGLEEPLYVVALRPERQEVIVGPREALRRDLVTLKELNWLGGAIPAEGLPVQVKLRSVMAPVAARIQRTGADQALITLDTPEYGISPGQACAIYAESRLLGGGWITATALAGNHKNLVAA